MIMDVDDTILHALSRVKSLSPKELKRLCMKRGISRSTYFRHLGKLKKQRQIEEIRIVNSEEAAKKKEYRRISPDELAGSEDIKFYLAEIANSDETIQNRGLRLFGELCSITRVAWFFSSNGEAAAFKNRLTKGADNVRLVFLEALENMIRREPQGSLWRIKLIESVKETIVEIATSERNAELSRRALRIAKFAADAISVTDLGFKVLEKPMSDKDFNNLLSELRDLLISSGEAKIRKISIREQLDRISTRDDILKSRVSKLLERAPP
jgi:hypothetical protein